MSKEDSRRNFLLNVGAMLCKRTLSPVVERIFEQGTCRFRPEPFETLLDKYSVSRFRLPFSEVSFLDVCFLVQSKQMFGELWEY